MFLNLAHESVTGFIPKSLFSHTRILQRHTIRVDTACHLRHINESWLFFLCFFLKNKKDASHYFNDLDFDSTDNNAHFSTIYNKKLLGPCYNYVTPDFILHSVADC